MAVGAGVLVGLGVLVGVGGNVAVGVRVGVGVAVGAEVAVGSGVAVGTGVGVGSGVDVGAGVGLGSRIGVEVGGGRGDAVAALVIRAGGGKGAGVGTGVFVGAAVGSGAAVVAGSVGAGVGLVQARAKNATITGRARRIKSGTPFRGENAGYRAKLAITLGCQYKRGRVGAPSFRSLNGLQ